MSPYALAVSENKRFLVKRSDKTPVFPMGDTAFEIFYRLNREEIDYYLTNRAAKRFTLIAAAIFSIWERLDLRNTEGELPFIDSNAARPNEAFFRLVDHAVNKAESLGMYFGLIPLSTSGPGVLPFFSPENAHSYGKFLGARYRNKPVVWVVGDNHRLNSEFRWAAIRALAEGIKEGSGGEGLITFLPENGHSSSEEVQSEGWVDFNSMQSCHFARDLPTYEYIAWDYAKKPTKPTWEIEYSWENGGVNWNPELGRYGDYDVRKGTYWSLFAGGFGCMYGSYDVVAFSRGDEETKQYQVLNSGMPGTPWKAALEHPGACQMAHARALMESRPFLTRIPDQSLLVSKTRKGAEQVCATRDSEGRYAFIYAVTGQPVTVDLEKLNGGQLTAWWFDPRLGSATKIGELPRSGTRKFTPPTSGYGQDWVLVLDDAAQKWPAPGNP